MYTSEPSASHKTHAQSISLPSFPAPSFAATRAKKERSKESYVHETLQTMGIGHWRRKSLARSVKNEVLWRSQRLQSFQINGPRVTSFPPRRAPRSQRLVVPHSTLASLTAGEQCYRYTPAPTSPCPPPSRNGLRTITANHRWLQSPATFRIKIPAIKLEPPQSLSASLGLFALSSSRIQAVPVPSVVSK